MNSKYQIALALAAGVALGAAAVQGLHAQAKPKAYIVTESELLDAAALATYLPKAQRRSRPRGNSSSSARTSAVTRNHHSGKGGRPPRSDGLLSEEPSCPRS